MNILGVGAPELILIFVIALIVAGPQRMIRWAYHLGKWSAKMRVMWSELMAVVQNEINQAGLDIEVPKNIPTRADVGRVIESAAKPYIKPVEEALKEAEKTRLDVNKLGSELKTTAQAKLEAPAIKDSTEESPDVKASAPTSPAKNNGIDYGAWTGKKNQQ